MTKLTMKILLDFDGVMITTPSWRKVPRLDDGFLAFNPLCARNLAEILQQCPAEIVLTTTHRIHYDNETWQQLLASRGIFTHKVSKINGAVAHCDIGNRHNEIIQWLNQHNEQAFIILDDDKSLAKLPADVKEQWIQTDFSLGLTSELKQLALQRLQKMT